MEQFGEIPYAFRSAFSAEESSSFSIPGTVFRELCPDPVKPGEIFPGILASIGCGDARTRSRTSGQSDAWPDKIWVLRYANGIVGTVNHLGVRGLAAFTKRANCIQYAASLPNPPSRTWLVKQMPFEEARLLAKKKASETARSGDPITAMILCDNGPLVLYVA